MLNTLFKFITGHKKSNWFSRRFWQYYYSERRKLENEYPRQELNLYFDVSGGGKLAVSKDADFICGDKAGFSIGVSWTMYPYCGGVLSRSEAKKLAEHILKQVDSVQESEEQQVANFYNGLNFNKVDYKAFTEAPKP